MAPKEITNYTFEEMRRERYEIEAENGRVSAFTFKEDEALKIDEEEDEVEPFRHSLFVDQSCERPSTRYGKRICLGPYTVPKPNNDSIVNYKYTPESNIGTLGTRLDRLCQDDVD